MSTSALQLQLRNISGKHIRTFSAAAAQAKSPKSDESAKFLPREDVKTTSSDGLVVSTVETNRPISKIAVYLRAGSRFQNENNQGVTHALRLAAGLGSKASSRFSITRNIEALGGNLYCTIGREHVAYTLEAARDQIEKLEPFFKDAVARQEFKQWEIEDLVTPRLRNDLLLLSPEVRVLEMIHWAAYRRGLGNSLYSPKFMVGQHNQEMLQDYVQRNFVEASVVGVGVSQDTATRLTQGLNIKKGDNSTQPSKFNAGEIRKDVGGDLAYVCLAMEGVSLSDRKAALASAVAQRALGTGPRTKRGGNPGGKLAPAASEQGVASGFSASYSDSGILGAFIVGTPAAIQNATKKSAEILKSASFSDQEVARAKNILKADIANTLDVESELIDDIGLQSLINGSVSSFNETSQLIDSITASDVNNVIKKGKGKLAMAAFGKIGRVPYLDEL